MNSASHHSVIPAEEWSGAVHQSWAKRSLSRASTEKGCSVYDVRTCGEEGGPCGLLETKQDENGQQGGCTGMECWSLRWAKGACERRCPRVGCQSLERQRDYPREARELRERTLKQGRVWSTFFTRSRAAEMEADHIWSLVK